MRGVNGRVIALVTTAVALIVAGGNARGFQRQEQPAYRIQELQDLGGGDARGNSINDWGLVAGFSNIEGNTARQAMIWFLGRPSELPGLGGPNSSVTWPGQNNTGLVVGIAQTSTAQTRVDGWSCRGFFPGPDARKYTCLGVAWEWGRARALRAFGTDNSFAASANNLWQVVGWAETPQTDPSCINPTDKGFHAVLWDLNRNRTVALLPYRKSEDGEKDTASAATAINDRGQVVGISGTCDQSIGRHSARHAVLWENGTATLLKSDATSWNTPTAITERGDIIVGFANTLGADPVQPTLRAVLWTSRDDLCPKVRGTNMCDLGTIDDDTSAQAWGVNERGQVVGTSCGTGGCRAFLWENGKMQDLNEFKGDYPHTLESAMDINVFGQIGGRARMTATEAVAVVATPLR
jgi:probable HAF family extracellular repeat protein